MNRVYGYENEDLVFIFNANNIDRNSQIKLREYFKFCANPKIIINLPGM